MRLRLGIALAEAGRHEEALEALRLAAELDPGRARLHYRMGLAYEATGRRAEARASYERALASAADERRARRGSTTRASAARGSRKRLAAP